METLMRQANHHAGLGAVIASHWGRDGAASCDVLRPDGDVRPTGSRFEAAATHSAAISPTGKDAPGILLAAAAVAGHIGPPELQPIWAEEAMHRAYSILRLFVALKRRRSPASVMSNHLQFCLATSIAANLAALDAPSTRERVPCSMILREVARDLVALFGPGIGHVDLNCRVERVSLPAFKRRALVLLACELVVNALLHAFTGRVHGNIDVTLTVLSPSLAQLRITDDGVGMGCNNAARACAVAGGLAALLETELHRKSNMRSTTATVCFSTQEFA